MTRSADSFEVRVTRLACNSGETGRVLAPEIELGDSSVVVTFTVVIKRAKATNRCLMR
jgi:hypothetical protein